MIMPCINSTSACESGGSVAFVEGGSVLLGLPGAPGCTTTGLPESPWCADTEAGKTRPKPRTVTKQRNGVVTFTTGLQDRTRTPVIAMLAPNTRGSLVIAKKWEVHYVRVLRQRAYCECHKDDSDEQRA